MVMALVTSRLLHKVRIEKNAFRFTFDKDIFQLKFSHDLIFHLAKNRKHQSNLHIRAFFFHKLLQMLNV